MSSEDNDEEHIMHSKSDKKQKTSTKLINKKDNKCL